VDASGKVYSPSSFLRGEGDDRFTGFGGDDDYHNDFSSSWVTSSASALLATSATAAGSGEHEEAAFNASTSNVAQSFVERVFSLSSSLIQKKNYINRRKSIAVTVRGEDVYQDVVLFPIVGCRLVPEYREYPASSFPHVVIRALPSSKSNPSCRIRNARNEVVVGHWSSSQQDGGRDDEI
jgi:hypothetical protein